MYNFVKVHVLNQQLIAPGEKVLLAVSGGADSMVMLDMLLTLSKEWFFSCMVITIDHQLRGEESAADRRFVEAYCERHAIPVVGCNVDVKGFKNVHQVGTQVAAREVRYQAFYDTMKMYDCDVLALAHHADDQVESLVMQLARSTEPRKLSGMPETRKFRDKRLIRPLIHLSKDDIYHYLKEKNIPHREDPSNQDDHYRRNAVRQHIIPKLKQFNPELLETTSVLMSHVKEDEDYLTNQAKKWFNQCVTFKKNKQVIQVKIPVVKKEARALQRRLFHLILNYLYDTLPSRLSYKHETAFFSLLQHMDGHRSIDLPEGLIMRQVYDQLLFEFESQEACETLGNQQENYVNQEDLPYVKTIVHMKEEATPNCLYLPYELYASGQYSIRTRKPGDRVYIPELNGHKKVSRIFIDQKVPQHKRDQWPLLVDKNDRVIWVMGMTQPLLDTHVEAKQYVKLMYQKKSL